MRRNIEDFKNRIKSWPDNYLLEEGMCLIWHVQDDPQVGEELKVVMDELRARNKHDLIHVIESWHR